MNLDPTLIDVVLIPLRGGNLLLPNVCVAEILPWRRLAEVDGAPPWYLGLLPWRQREIVVVSLEALSEAMQARASRDARPRCLVVMNRMRAGGDVEFYGVAAEALPRLLHLADEDIEIEGSGAGIEMLDVRLGTERAWIPDLEWVEHRISEHALTA